MSEAASGFRVRDSVRIQGQGQVSATAAGISDSQQRSATVNSDQRRIRPPGPDVHGHLRVVQKETSSRWDLRSQGVKCIARGGRPLDPGEPIDWGRCMNDPEVTMNNALPKNNLIATEKAIVAATAAISLVKRVPAPLKSIADQLVRSASSVPANLSEGHGRSGRDRIHHWRIAYASAKEVDTRPSPPSCRRRRQPVRHQVLTQPLRRSASQSTWRLLNRKMLIHQPGAAPSERKTAPHRGAGFDIVPERPPGFAALPAQCLTGLPRGAPRGQFSRRRGRPPASQKAGDERTV